MNFYPLCEDFLRITRFWLCLFLAVATAGCHAQPTPTNAAKDSTTSAAQATLNRRIKLKIRSAFSVPPDYTVTLGKRTKSDFTGYDTLPVTFSQDGHEKTTDFLISTDNNTLARMEKFDLSKNPMAGVSIEGRPVRGPGHALVTIVNFDDLECPFCARMHAVLFPATMDHYKSQVRFIYKNYPLVEIHPWAMHAAVDVDCLAAQSPKGYWNLVDYIHAHDKEISGNRDQPNLPATMQRLDQLTKEEGKRQGVNAAQLDSCIAKQDESGVRASMKEGSALGVDGTPTMFINGERSTGAVPQGTLWNVIDRAIIDAGGTPPPQEPAAGAESSPAQAPVK